MNNTNISVAMCSYNGELYLAQQLESMLIQTVLPDELIVCDDGSTDQTLEILNRFAKSAPFKVTIFENHQAPLGSTKNFEKAISLCSGEIIVLSDQDDVWMPNKIEALERAINGGAGLVFSDAELVNEKLEPLGYTLFDSLSLSTKEKNDLSQNLFFKILMRRNIVTGAAAAFSRRHLSLILPISDFWVHDGWIALLISSIDKIIIINQPLFNYRQHSKNQIGARKLSFIQKVKLARNLGNKYYQESLAGFEAIKLKLDALPINVLNNEFLNIIEHKIDHLRVRSRLTTNPLRSIVFLINELMRGRYHRLSRGWLSFFRDMGLVVLNKIER